MLDFTPVRNKEMTFADLVADLRPHDLRRLTNEMVETQLGLIANCVDADVVFVPEDPDAYDAYPASEEEMDMAWTLGHLVVHVTASSEETAFLAAELARGVPRREGRSRHEVHWSTMKTIEQCRQRLEESRRMRIATLNVWPDLPHLENMFTSYNGKEYNTITRFVFGLSHDDSHLEQIAEVVRQAKEARNAS